MIKLTPRYKQGNKSPDHDPDNPYHYHTGDGKKVVITPEDWEANIGKPYFKEIEDAVRAEQAAHPGPEYEVNPDFVRDLRSTYSYNMGSGYQNYRNFSSSLPQGYSFTDEGLIVDPQGNYYVQSGYRQSPRFTYSTDNPLLFTIYKGKPIERNLTFYPINMDKKVKAPLPVDRTLDVKAEYQAAVDNYIQNNINNRYGIGWYNHTSDSFKDKATYGTLGIFSFKNPEEYGWELGTEHYYPMSEGQRNKLNDAFNRVVNRQDKLGTYSKEDMLSILKAGGLEDLIDDFIATSTKPSRQEAEKKAVISVGPLKRVGTFATGGKLKLILRHLLGGIAHKINEHGKQQSRQPLSFLEYSDPRRYLSKSELHKARVEAQKRYASRFGHKYPFFPSSAQISIMLSLTDEVLKEKYKKYLSNFKTSTNAQDAASLSVFGSIIGMVPHPVTRIIGGIMTLPDLVYDISASIDEPKPSNYAHVGVNYLPWITKIIPGKYDDILFNPLGIIGNIDDAISSSDNDMFNFLNPKPKSNNNVRQPIPQGERRKE